VAVQTETNVKEIRRDEADLRQRTGIVVEHRLLPWLLGKDEYIYITSGVLPELEKEVGDIGGLKSMAELLGWGYAVIKVNGKATRAISTTVDGLVAFLYPEIDN
jgi:hypothetical protein